MTDQPPNDPAWTKLILAIVIAFALLTAVCGIAGWVQRGPALGLSGARIVENAIYMTLRAFTFDSVYAEKEQIGDNGLVVVARWTGLVVFASGLIAAFVALTRKRLLDWRLSRQKQHTLIIGDHPIVPALVSASRAKGLVIHMSRLATATSDSGGVTTVPRVDWDDPLRRGRAYFARRVLIAETNFGQSAETVQRVTGLLQKKARETETSNDRRWRAVLCRPDKVEDTRVSVHFDDPVVAEGFHHTQAHDVSTFCPAQAAARAVLDAHPPFRLARLCGASRIHILLLGFGRLAEEILRDTVFNNVSRNLGQPLVTVIDADAGAEAAFRDRHPQIHNACEIRFRVGPIGKAIDSLVMGIAAGEPHVCAAYVCCDRTSDAFATAIALREHAQIADAFRAPIFLNLTSASRLIPALSTSKNDPLRLVVFGEIDETIRAAGVLDDDTAARSIHEAYSAIAQTLYGAGIVTPWRELPEELRVSNRRAVTHILAKLDSLDFDLGPWLALPPDKRPHPLALHPDHPLFRNEDDRDMAAKLEHCRWMADRWVNGWRYGAKTDRPHKVHADLIPFEALPEDIQSFDYKVVDWLNEFLPRRPDGLRRGP